MYLFAASMLVADFYQQTVRSHQCFDNGSICFELLKGLPAAFVALIIGLIAAGIAWRQYRVARAKLKLDLFAKRYGIFRKVWRIFSFTALNGPKDDGLFTPFNNLLPQAAFLFGKDIEEYLSLATFKWTRLKGLNAEGMLRPATAAEREQLEQWFLTEANGGAKKRFEKYLSFENWT